MGCVVLCCVAGGNAGELALGAEASETELWT